MHPEGGSTLDEGLRNVVAVIFIAMMLLFAGCLNENPNGWAFELTQIDKMKSLGFDGEGVRIGIVDTGVDIDHVNMDRDKLVAWLDLINDNNEPYDDNGHGTFITALLLSKGGDLFGSGIEGICPDSQIVVVKAVSDTGYTNDILISKAIDFCIQKDVDIILLSLYKNPETINIGNKTMEKCEEAIDRGIFLVAPAGDDGVKDDGDVFELAGIDETIGVGSISKNLYISTFSSKGNQALVPGKHEAREDPNKKPELVAPGEDIESITGWASVIKSGTSISAAFIAGSLALLLEAYPDLKKSGKEGIEKVKEVLAKTAKKVGGEEIYWGNGLKHNDRYGYGLIQVYDAYVKLGEST